MLPKSQSIPRPRTQAGEPRKFLSLCSPNSRQFKCMEHWGSSKCLGSCPRQGDSHTAHMAPKRHLGIWHKKDSPLQATLLLLPHPIPFLCNLGISLHPLK